MALGGAARAAPRPREGPSPPSFDRALRRRILLSRPDTRTTGALERRPHDNATARSPEPGAAAQTGQGARARAPGARARPLRLSDAQLAARARVGFPSWPRLKAYVERVSANGPELAHAFVDEIGYYEDRAEGLRSVVESGLESGIAIVRAHHPTLAGATDAEIRALSPADARLVLAREHGFPSWAAFRRHVDALAESGELFRRAFRAIQARDATALGALLDRYPGLVTARGTNGNDLLGLAAYAVCGRSDQAIVRDLLARGADPNSANDRGWTPLHQAGYGNDLRLAGLLLAAGARATSTGTARAARRSPLPCSGDTPRSPTSWQSAKSCRATCASPPGSAGARRSAASCRRMAA